MEDCYLERETQKIHCVHCDDVFNDDDIVSIFDEPLCDDCIDYLLQHNVSYLKRMLKTSKVDECDVSYLLERLAMINKERK